MRNIISYNLTKSPVEIGITNAQCKNNCVYVSFIVPENVILASYNENVTVKLVLQNSTSQTKTFRNLVTNEIEFEIPFEVYKTAGNIVVSLSTSSYSSGDFKLVVLKDLYSYMDIMVKKESNQYVICSCSGNSTKNLLYTPFTVDNKLTVTAIRDDYWEMTSNYAYLEKGKVYIFSCETDGTFGTSPSNDTVEMFIMKDKTYSVYAQIYKNPMTFVVAETGNYYLRVDVNKNGVTHSFWNFMIEEVGNNLLVTPYHVKNQLKVTATKDDYWITTDYYAHLEKGKKYKIYYESNGTGGLDSGTDTVQGFLLYEKGYDYIKTFYKRETIFEPTRTGNFYLRVDVNKNGMTHSFWDFIIIEQVDNNLLITPYNKINQLTITAIRDDYWIETDYYAHLERGKKYKITYESDGVGGRDKGTDTVQGFLLYERGYDYITTFYETETIFEPTRTGNYYLRVDVNKNDATHSFWNFMIEEVDISTKWVQGNDVDESKKSEWIDLEYTSDFKCYSDNILFSPKCRKIGEVISVRGILSPTKILTNQGTELLMFTLPALYSPRFMPRYFVCHGSGSNKWLLTVKENGNVMISRYGTTSFIDIPENAWLPFDVTFMI